MKIVHSHQAYPAADPLHAAMAPSERVLREHWETHRRARGEEDIPLFIPYLIDASDSVEIQIRQGRWCALCPWCPSGQYASPTDPRFYCVNCRNRGSRTWARIILPANWHEIEAVLAERTDPDAMDWLPGETVEKLREENIQHAEEIAAVQKLAGVVEIDPRQVDLLGKL